MRRTNVQFKEDRRAEILKAAQRCFARAGFHQTSMNEICAEAGMSPGNLYRYFPAKEAIIAGIAERDRADAAQQFAALEASPDFFTGLAALARQHLVTRSAEEVALCAEIMAESRRNPDIARIYHAVDDEVQARFQELLEAAAKRGEIAPHHDFRAVSIVLLALADGLSWRRAVDPHFDVEVALPLVLDMVRCVLARPRGPEAMETSR